MIEIELQAKFDNFIKLRENLFYFLESYNCPNGVRSEIFIVTEEIFTNIIKHSYNGQCDKIINIKMTMIDDIFTLRFIDEGRIFGKIVIPESLSEIKGEIGGLGLYLINKLSDSYSYRREDNKNINEIKKKIK